MSIAAGSSSDSPVVGNTSSFKTGGADSDRDVQLAKLFDEFALVVQRGEEASIEVFLASHSQFADELRELLPTIRAMAGLPIDHIQTDPLPEDSVEPKPQRMIGDFILVREIGRGGMGVVYEAEQVSMGRTVALKILPFAAVMDPRHVQRFKTEVQAAALLQHQNIVPVYSVGCERGVHYYAMQFVSGHTLSELIAELHAGRQNPALAGSSVASEDDVPNGDVIASAALSTGRSTEKRTWFRSATKLMVQAADALEHAHSRGVVHRDIKPGNMMVDATGNLWITDFGLARVDVDSSITMTGDVVGTLRYMSPEQALGSVVDARTDVYSLGATMYELLATCPAFAGQERHQLLRQIAEADPKRLRKHDSAIPRELETIVHKAMEKSPTCRYASAGELADDLRRFLDHRPILAKPPSTVERIRKWSLRHVGVVWTALLASVVLMISLGLATLAILASHKELENQREIAIHESRSAKSAERLAQGRLERALAAEQEAKSAKNRSEKLLYAADIQLAYQAWDSQRIDQVSDILQRQLPVGNEQDRRGLEWFLLESLAAQSEPVVIGHHEGAVNEIALFPDQQRVASAGDDGKVNVWRIETGELLATIDTGDQPLHALAVSPDQQTIATGNSRVQLWELASGRQERVLTTHQATVEAIAFSPDGQRIVTGSRYHCVRLFSRSGEMLREIQDGNSHLTLQFTPDGNRLLVPSREGARRDFVRVWRADMSTPDFDIREPSDGFGTMAHPSQDGSLFVVSDNYANRVQTRVFSAETGEELLRLPSYHDKVVAVGISSDEQIIAAGFMNGSVGYWRIARDSKGHVVTTDRTYSFQAHDGRVKSLCFAGPRRILTCGRDGTIKSWRLPDHDNPKQVGPGMNGMALAPDGTVSAVIADEQRLQLFTPHGELVGDHEDGSADLGPYTIEFSPDGRLIATFCDARDLLELWDARTGTVVKHFFVGTDLEDLSFCPTRPELAAATYRKGRLLIVDLESLEVIRSVSLGRDDVYRCVYSPCGKYLICGGEDCGISILDALTSQIVKRISTPSIPSSLAVDPRGEMFVSGHDDGTIRLWEFPAGELRTILLGHEAMVRNLAFSPDGGMLASASNDSTIRLWSIDSQRAIGVLARRENAWAWDVAFAPDASRLYATFTTPPGLAIFTLKQEADRNRKKADFHRQSEAE